MPLPLTDHLRQSFICSWRRNEVNITMKCQGSLHSSFSYVTQKVDWKLLVQLYQDNQFWCSVKLEIEYTTFHTKCTDTCLLNSGREALYSKILPNSSIEDIYSAIDIGPIVLEGINSSLVTWSIRQYYHSIVQLLMEGHPTFRLN
jgi:hypothetical protein